MGMLRARRVLVKTENGVVNVFAKVSGATIFRFRYIPNSSDRSALNKSEALSPRGCTHGVGHALSTMTDGWHAPFRAFACHPVYDGKRGRPLAQKLRDGWVATPAVPSHAAIIPEISHRKIKHVNIHAVIRVTFLRYAISSP